MSSQPDVAVFRVKRLAPRIAPLDVCGAAQTPTRSHLPFLLSRQAETRPSGIGESLEVADSDDRVPGKAPIVPAVPPVTRSRRVRLILEVNKVGPGRFRPPTQVLVTTIIDERLVGRL